MAEVIPLPAPCQCGGERLVYHELGLPPILVCIDCHRWEPAEPATEA